MGDLQGLLPLPAVGRQFGQGGVEVGHTVDQDRVFPLDVVGQQHQRWARGERDGSDSGAIAWTAKTARPPRTWVKYARSAATSRLGVYTKSSCWKGGVGWSTIGNEGGERVPPETCPHGVGGPVADPPGPFRGIFGDTATVSKTRLD